MHHNKAPAHSSNPPADVSWLPIDEDLTAVRVNQAVEDVHQRGFARAVLANQGMDFTLVYRKINMIVGDDTRPGFGDVVHLLGKRCRTLLGFGHTCPFWH